MSGEREVTTSEIKSDLCFETIMTKEVLFYCDDFKEDCKAFCEKRNITYLPCKGDFDSCYTLVKDRFKKRSIQESQRVFVNDKIFNASFLEKFEKHHVLFVFMKDELRGVVHFCDYNRNPVSTYVYSLLLHFERKLRELLVNEGLNNSNMITFFEKQVKKNKKNEYYLRKVENYKKPEIQKEMKELELFQTFCLKDLIDLLHSKKIYDIPQAINLKLRNPIMHSKNIVRHDDYENSTLIYNFTSFCDYLELVNSLKLEIENISKKIPQKVFEEEYILRLRNAGLFVEIE